MASILDILEAKEEIRDLINHYCYTTDFGLSEEWVNCFTEDGVFDSPAFGRFSGKTALRKLQEDTKAFAGSAKLRHVVTNVHIDVDVDAGSATSESYWLFARAAEGKTEILLTGRYVDRIVKVKGKWLLKEVMVDPDLQIGKDEMKDNK